MEGDAQLSRARSIRSARPGDTRLLTDIAFQAKASWGYSADFMTSCRAELTYDAARLAQLFTLVAELDGRPAGFIAASGAEIEALFVLPLCQRAGIGRALLDHLLAWSTEPVLFIDADPHAEPIYRRWGFVTIGRVASGSIPGRTLPRMRLERSAICTS
jgi:GNAT superfamily N-acetyltransferase